MRRFRVPLILIAVGFLLGSLVTAYAQELIYIPFVSRAGAETVGVEVVNVHQTSATDIVGFFGEVRNDTEEAVWLHGVTVRLLDGGGFPVQDLSTPPGPGYIVPPGDRRPFLVFTEEPVSDWASYLTSVEWEPTSYLEVISQQLRPTSQGWAIDVRAENQHPVAVRDPIVVGILYGPEGVVIGYSQAVPGLDSPDLLLPGAQFTATVTFDRDDIFAYDADVYPSGYNAIVVP